MVIRLKNALKGVRVVGTHQTDKTNRYKITGISSTPLEELMFDQHGTRKQQYNYSLKFTHWSCLEAGSDSTPIYLLMEVCSILEGQRYCRKLNERQVTSTLKTACERPAQRESSILEVNLLCGSYLGPGGSNLSMHLFITVKLCILVFYTIWYHWRSFLT